MMIKRVPKRALQGGFFLPHKAFFFFIGSFLMFLVGLFQEYLIAKGKSIAI